LTVINHLNIASLKQLHEKAIDTVDTDTDIDTAMRRDIYHGGHNQ